MVQGMQQTVQSLQLKVRHLQELLLERAGRPAVAAGHLDAWPPRAKAGLGDVYCFGRHAGPKV